MELPKNDASLRDVMYLVKNGISVADALALSSEDQRRCARAFAELQNLTLIPEDGMRWKSAPTEHRPAIYLDGAYIASVVTAHIASQTSPPHSDCRSSIMKRPTTFDVLGLSEEAAAGLTVEHLMPERADPTWKGGVNGLPVARDCTLISKALRGLADSIDAKRIDIMKMGISAEIERDKIITQKLTLDFCIPVNN